jgi:hypothetical protein
VKRGRSFAAGRRGRAGAGALSGTEIALGAAALIGGIGLLAAGARRQQQHSNDGEALDRELDSLGLERLDREGAAPRLEQGSDGILRQVVDTTAAEVPIRR